MNKTLCALLIFFIIIAFAINYSASTEGFANIDAKAFAYFGIVMIILFFAMCAMLILPGHV